ncbi:Velvet complex subunit ryp3 [Ophidiomyces ophidiicola]|nr:Velvet complex subunit ryp3 [Ophidiomyces ophidiicola]
MPPPPLAFEAVVPGQPPPHPHAYHPGAAAPPPSARTPQLPPPQIRHPPPPPTPVTTLFQGRIFALDVVQQPIRARMCGFGDKDRRPITPPPCVRLRVMDSETHKEIDVMEIDTSFFVLTVDLWNADGDREVNLVRHSATSPSISTASASSFPPPPPMPQYPPYTPAMYAASAGYAPYYTSPPAAYPSPALAYSAAPGQAYYPMAAAPGYYAAGGPAMAPPSVMAPPLAPTQPTGMFTRNLIGSLSASAFKLTDPDNKLGIWFILQDLSVRTEGSFRLKMNFVNVGADPADSMESGPVLNHGSAPVLASVFSEVFHVFSAKKFPGVIESTPLSKCFAIQGIKIPIRKDGVKGARGAAAALAAVKDREDLDDWED